jgi:hypothetical protein
MTPEEMIKAAEEDRLRELVEMKIWRDYYQRQVERLEAMAPAKQSE